MTGTIEKVTRANGKAGAQVVITVPASSATTIPLGSMVITFEPNQGELDLGPEAKGNRSRVRGDQA